MLLPRILKQSIQNKTNNVRRDMFKTNQITGAIRAQNVQRKSTALTALMALLMSGAIHAQEADPVAAGQLETETVETAQAEAEQTGDSPQIIEEVFVTGVRREIQTSIDLKRMSTEIVDGLSADEIGDIPALSIGDALETVTGVTSHRENGGASEITVRGLGPFLGTTTINGREATNGGGNRAVNFSIFPSEMFNKVSVHKTQSAEYIEGAVSGQIQLNTKKPLDYGKRLFNADFKGAYSPDEQDIDGGQDLGSRATVAYIDQYEFDSGAAIGFSLAVQLRDETNPEQEYTTTSGEGRLEACELTSFDSNALPTDTDGRCHDGTASVQNDKVQALIDSNPDYNSVKDIPFAYIPRDHRYRQNTTDDERESYFASFQFQPNDRLDINLDYQYSERDQTEIRNDMQYGTTQEDLSSLTSNPNTGVVRSSISETQIYAYTTDFERDEEYEGYGVNFDFAINDNLNLFLDYGYSDTQRVETDVELRLGATDNNLEGGDSDDFTVQLDVNQGDGTGISTILDDGGNGFEVYDPSYYNARNRGRLRAREITRDNELEALRADLVWARDTGAIHTIKGGVRGSSMTYFTKGGLRDAPGESLFEDEDLVTPDGGADGDVTDEVLANVLACANQSFPEDDFLSNVRDAPLVTNNSSGSTVSEYATFDHNCATDAWLVNYGGRSGIQFQDGITPETRDVTEDTIAIYLQADFETEFAGYPVRGNFGVRYVDTEIKSVGYRAPFSVEVTEEDTYIVTQGDAEDGFTIAKEDSDYQKWLPSFTLIVDLQDDLILRTGAFRGMSRPDPDAYGNSIEFDDEQTEYDTLEEVVNGITKGGNPYLKPIMSYNVDLGLEWYPNPDTIIAGIVYWKEFNGSFETTAQIETFDLDGFEVDGTVRAPQTSNEDSTITGFELTLSHSFSYLPGFWSGFGGKISYNYADSNFDYEDAFGGDGTFVDIDEATGEATETPLIGVLPPANLFGLSEHVSSTQLYWGNKKWNLSAIYKTRSEYFQQYTRDTSGRVRYTGDSETLDVRVRYKLFDNVDISLEGKNVLDEERTDYRAIDGNVLQKLSYGPRYWLGVKMKF